MRHFSQPKFSARVSECCPRTLAPLTWFRQPLLNNVARRCANSKLLAVCQEQPCLESRRKRGCRYRILYPGSTVLHAAFRRAHRADHAQLGRPCPSSICGPHKENNGFLRFFWPMATRMVSILWHDHWVIFPCDACCGYHFFIHMQEREIRQGCLEKVCRYSLPLLS